MGSGSGRQQGKRVVRLSVGWLVAANYINLCVKMSNGECAQNVHWEQAPSPQVPFFSKSHW
jgi:hypothetical protein